MGYYTNYSLYALNKNESHISNETLIEASIRLCEIMGENEHWPHYKEEIAKTPDYPFDWICNDCMKWYDHSSDMTQLASEFPNIIFMLEGHGEEFEDHWREYYYGDKYEYVTMEWNPAPDWANIAPL